jgi:hypothetical protein
MRRFVVEIAAAALLFALIPALLFALMPALQSSPIPALQSAPVVASPASALAATGDGLVNVKLNDVEIAKNVNLGIAAVTVASVCYLADPNITALASQVDQTDRPQSFTCPATGGQIWIVQN